MEKTTFLSSMPVALGASIGLLVFGLYSFLSQWAYSEPGHEYLAIAIAVVCTALFFALRLSKIGLSIVLIIIFGVTWLYAGQKFEWRKDYIESAKTRNFFAFDQYIERYPTFEEHHFSWITDHPRYVAFSRDCYKPLINAPDAPSAVRAMSPECRTERSIAETYNIDIKKLIHDYHDRMRHTAKQIERERFRTKTQLADCIKNKTCAMIPLLPEGDDVNFQSEENRQIRNQFWSLIEDKDISWANCSYFDLCRLMVQGEVIDFEDL